MITFQANYLNSASIKRINTYKPSIKKVAFVEINPNNPSDVLALHKAAIKWDKTGGEGFAYDICEAVNKGKPDRFFALTTQHDRFDNLNFKQILSLAQVKTESKGEQYIEFLQVDPENSNKSEEPESPHIGTAMLNCLKNIFIDKTIELDSVKSAISFYLRNGFTDAGPSGGGERRMYWEHNLSTLHKKITC